MIVVDASVLANAIADDDADGDAAYVALAEVLDCPLVTADARLARASGIRCEVELVDRPR